jgi:hypothetical protein
MTVATHPRYSKAFATSGVACRAVYDLYIFPQAFIMAVVDCIALSLPYP